MGEVERVEFGVLGGMRCEFVVRDDGVHGTCLDTGAAVDTAARVDVEHLCPGVVRFVRRWVNTVRRAHYDARSIVAARLGNYVCHRAGPLAPSPVMNVALLSALGIRTSLPLWGRVFRGHRDADSIEERHAGQGSFVSMSLGMSLLMLMPPCSIAVDHPPEWPHPCG